MINDNYETAEDTVRGEIIEREAARTAALVVGRFGEVADIYDDRLTYTHSNGWRDDKQSLLARVTEAGMRYEEFEHRLDHVTVIGDIAAATGLMHAVVATDGHRHEVSSLTSTVWTRRSPDEPWTMLLFHSSATPTVR
ncbi:nuclear transport factor 2 family protein [Nocardia sp. FBN12]|uniref:nuclear transport factor 2 family protein n=1 Tax=Nocardia sp. FBN12 TaxID=3419766 RepID=UPI003D063842